MLGAEERNQSPRALGVQDVDRAASLAVAAGGIRDQPKPAAFEQVDAVALEDIHARENGGGGWCCNQDSASGSGSCVGGCQRGVGDGLPGWVLARPVARRVHAVGQQDHDELPPWVDDD